jgi:LytS/YehU family sensor histidine kinase
LIPKNKVYLNQEIENIQDFIDIQKIRYKLIKVEFNDSIDDQLQEISPLILLQFVENAFKHGASESRFNSFITINLELKNKVLVYSIENSKEENPEKESTKIGLKNIKRQLDLLYPKHSLEINDSNNLYSVSLKILFD